MTLNLVCFKEKKKQPARALPPQLLTTHLPQQPHPQAGSWWLFFILMLKLVALILQHVVLCVAINV